MGTQGKETEKWNEVGTDSVAPIRFRARWYLSQINPFQTYMYATIRSCFFSSFFSSSSFCFFFFISQRFISRISVQQRKRENMVTRLERKMKEQEERNGADETHETVHKLHRLRQRRWKRDSRNYARGYGAI